MSFRATRINDEVRLLLIDPFHSTHGDDQQARSRINRRSIAVLLGIATTRPVMGVFFATSRLTHLVPQQFFGVAFWIGFSINVLVFELWLQSLKSTISS